MRFVHPWLLLLLSAVPLLGLAWLWLSRQAARNLSRLIALPLQPRLTPPRAALRFHFQLALSLTAIALLIVAAARPQWGQRDEQVSSRGRNLVIALDVSRSMLARDVHPNRLERAKVDVMDLIGDLQGDRAALLAFRRRGILLCPLTTDYAFLRQALDGVSIESAPRGETDLADAIRKSLDALSPAQDDYNAIMLISDGEDLAGAALDAAREAGKRGVPIFTVGIGDTSGTPVPQDDGSPLTYQGKAAETRLMEDSLMAIARESGGRYVALGTAGTAQTTLGSIFRQHLRQVAAREQQERLEHRAIERYQWFLLPALLLLLAAALLSRGRLGGTRAIRPAPLTPPTLPAALLLLGVLIPVAQAQTASPPPPAAAPAATSRVERVASGRAGARAAQSLDRCGRWVEAAEAYAAAARGADTDEAQTYLYNAALARHRAGQDAEAEAILQPLTHGRDTADRASELLGAVAFHHAGRADASATNAAEAAAARVAAMELAGAGFEQALRDQPAEKRRRENLARVQNLLPSLREDARVARLLAQHGQTPPDRLIATMLHTQRDLLEQAPSAFTNAAPDRIRLLEALAERQSGNADLWVPLKQAVLQSPSLTNAQQRAEFERAVEFTRDSMNAGAERLRDIDPESYRDLCRSEPAVYRFWRGMSPPPPLLDEDIALQSNALTRAEHPVVPFRPDQPEAGQLTTLFQERFPAWADRLAQQAQSDTNAPTLKPEDRKEIERLTKEVLELQRQAEQATEAATVQAAQRTALQKLLRIRELLPNQKQQRPPQPQPQSQPPPEQPPPQPQPQPEQEPKQEPEKEQAKPQPEKAPRNVENLLQRALQREKEHEAEKRERMQHIPMLPNERDQ